MKKIFLTIAIFITANNYCFSQENEKVKPNSKIGGGVGSGINLVEFFAKHTDTRFEVFYHKTLSKFWYLSCNAGYIYCVGENGFIPITVGINFFYPNDYVVPYIGYEMGVSNRLNFRNDMEDKQFGLLWGLRYGVYVPISKLNINLGVGITVQIATENRTEFIGASWVLSYSIPKKQNNNTK